MPTHANVSAHITILYTAFYRRLALALRRIGLCAPLLLVGCQAVNTTQGGAVGVQRSQRMALSQQAVDHQSALAYNEIKQKAQQQHALNVDPAMVDRVRSIAHRLIAQVAVFRADAPKWPWETNVVNSNTVNAFCMAGGKIIVYSGLINQLKITDDELAAVMGHEIAHALREHVREQASEQQVLGVGAALGGILFGIEPRLTQSLAQIGIGLPHSRRAEVEADQIGLELAARAGFNPKGAITLWQKMGRLGGSQPPQFLSTHPSPQSREADLIKVSDVVMPLYRAALESSAANQPRR